MEHLSIGEAASILGVAVSTLRRWEKVTLLDEDNGSCLEKNLVADVIELMTVFSARLHGSRSHKNKKMLKAA